MFVSSHRDPVVIDDASASAVYPDVDYSIMRRNYHASQVVIPYKPAEEPAWSKHQNSLPPKPARFQKLNRWDVHAERIKLAAQLAILAAGAATMAPAVMKLVH